MRTQDIKIGEYYRHRTSNYAYAKAISILKPKQAENYNNFVVVKCEWSTDKSGIFGIIKYFRPCDLVKDK